MGFFGLALLGMAGCCAATRWRFTPKPMFDLGGRHIDFAALDSPGSRLVLALGVPAVLTPFHERKLQVFYLEEKEETKVLREAFKRGGSGLVLDGTHKIPFVDLNFDIVVLGSGWCGGSCDKQSADEYLRVLRPSGKLLLWNSDSKTIKKYPPLDSKTIKKHPLLAATAFKNLFVRVESNIPGLPFCKKANKGESCQPYVSKEYISVDAPSRRNHFRKLRSLSRARLTHQHIENAAHPENEEEATFVTKRLQDAINGSKWYSEQYLGKRISAKIGKTQRGERWSFPKKHQGWEPRHTEWIRSGKVKNLLDAGAGTCSIDVLLRQQGLTPAYVGFGFYDHSMARICTERGSLIFDWDWSKKLAICKDCAYDMVFQSGGMHHVGTPCLNQTMSVDCMKEALQTQLDNFDAVLKCGGNLVMHDYMTDFVQGKGTSKQKTDWIRFAKKWAGKKKYVVEKVSEKNQVEITKTC